MSALRFATGPSVRRLVFGMLVIADQAEAAPVVPAPPEGIADP